MDSKFEGDRSCSSQSNKDSKCKGVSYSKKEGSSSASKNDSKCEDSFSNKKDSTKVEVNPSLNLNASLNPTLYKYFRKFECGQGRGEGRR
ncbi:uncharacterized protein G2W53_016831 [Senna tora]|uniref:Uncharacterized protein n=1 Tax=Senna tora TaxID=362788 RepID=A0A834WJV8_9FABA|nr:uncharacterized protein G2W53_016831 [Senna tora]